MKAAGWRAPVRLYLDDGEAIEPRQVCVARATQLRPAGRWGSARDRFLPTDRELARIGLNESEAKAKGVDYRLIRIPMSSVLRMRTLSELREFIKLLIAAESDHILGLTVFGTEASEILAAVQTAMLGGLAYTTLRDAIFTHPTAAEGLTVLLANVPAKQASKAA